MMTECSRITDAPSPTPNKLNQKAVKTKTFTSSSQPTKQANKQKNNHSFVIVLYTLKSGRQ